MATDPYSSPVAKMHPVDNSGDSRISDAVIQQLAATKPWVRFISVLIFVGAGFLVLFALGVILMGGAIASASSNPMFSGGMGALIAAAYLVMAIFYIYPGVKLWKYASCIKVLTGSGATFDLEMALSQQRSFWKYVGVIMLIVLSLYALIAIIAIIGAVTGGFSAMKAGSA